MSEFSAASFLALSWKPKFWFVPDAASLLALSFVFASPCHTWELDTASFWFEPPATSLPAHAIRFKNRPDALSIPGTIWCTRTRLCHNSFFSCFLLHSFRHRFGAAYQAGILSAASGAENADIEQMEKMVPHITCEITLCQYVCELVFGDNMFDLDFGVRINSIEQPIESNSVGSGNMSHCWISAHDDHLDHRFIVPKHIQ